jgi:hypothetical protein
LIITTHDTCTCDLLQELLRAGIEVRKAKIIRGGLEGTREYLWPSLHVRSINTLPASMMMMTNTVKV